jgi:hypothetical protein
VALLVLVALLNAVAVVERLAGPLLVLAAVGLVVWAVACRGRRPVPPGRPPNASPGRAENAELIRLLAENAQLRAELDAARDSAYAAWQDATDSDSRDATEPGSRDATVVDLRARLLRDARSGAGPL